MTEENRRFALAERPHGLIDESTFAMETGPVPEIGEGEALVRVKWISIDPTNRTWIGEEPTYLPPVQIGETMRALGLGEVIASNHENYPVGALVNGLTGWQDYTVVSDSNPLMVVPEGIEARPSDLLGILGMTGVTAYFGMLEIGEPKEGETVVVSAAAGAVGSVAGQIAKLKGARVVGIAGGQEKCDWVVSELGFDAAVDYKADDWRQQLKDATPDGIDVDFENVGGEIMDAVFARMNIASRVALCGLISGYNAEDGRPAGPASFGNLLIKRVKLQGFIILDYYPRFGEAIRQLSEWVDEGKLKSEQTVVEGFENLPNALNMLFKGENKGKLVVRIEG